MTKVKGSTEDRDETFPDFINLCRKVRSGTVKSVIIKIYYLFSKF